MYFIRHKTIILSKNRKKTFKRVFVFKNKKDKRGVKNLIYIAFKRKIYYFKIEIFGVLDSRE